MTDRQADERPAGETAAPPASRLIGDSAAMGRLRAQIPAVAASDSTVVIVGESGVGKELVAREIHAHSRRRSGPFVAINCGAIPEALAEAELFGYERGAFTGAVAGKPGKFERAHGGTLFLDEVGELPQPVQVKLLRALQERLIDRVGGRQPVPVNVRILAATHRDLEACCRAGIFRWDLYYRLSVLVIEVPPLRERPEDIPALALRHAAKVAAGLGRSVTVSPAALARLQQYPWPGNVRELENVVERAVVLKGAGVIEPEDLVWRAEPPVWPRTAAPGEPGEPAGTPALGPGFCLAEALAAYEARWIAQALRQAQGVVAHAARLLGINRTTLIERLRRFEQRYGRQWAARLHAAAPDPGVVTHGPDMGADDRLPATIWRLPVHSLSSSPRRGRVDSSAAPHGRSDWIRESYGAC